MSFLDRLLGKLTVRTAPPAPVPVTWPPMVLVPGSLAQVSSGNKLIRGFLIRDANTNRGISQEELGEIVPGAVVFYVTGTSIRLYALQGPAFERGQPVELIPQPTSHDRNRIAVWDANRRAHIGFVPAELAPHIKRTLASRQAFSAVCHFEFLENDRRVGLSVLFAPTTFVESLTIDEDR
jgi:hypothetical protein